MAKATEAGNSKGYNAKYGDNIGGILKCIPIGTFLYFSSALMYYFPRLYSIL